MNSQFRVNPIGRSSGGGGRRTGCKSGVYVSRRMAGLGNSSVGGSRISIVLTYGAEHQLIMAVERTVVLKGQERWFVVSAFFSLEPERLRRLARDTDRDGASGKEDSACHAQRCVQYEDEGGEGGRDCQRRQREPPATSGQVRARAKAQRQRGEPDCQTRGSEDALKEPEGLGDGSNVDDGRVGRRGRRRRCGSAVGRSRSLRDDLLLLDIVIL